MKKLLIVSDSHGDEVNLRRAVRAEADADALIFLGDGLRDLEALKKENFTRPVYAVRGNCDRTDDPLEGLVPFGGVLLFYTHGHEYGVKAGCERLQREAAARGADIALFGHTHRPFHAEEAGLPALFNPGSLQQGRYGIVVCDGGQFICRGERLE